MCNSSAAALKPPRRATASIASSSTSPDLYIDSISGTTHPDSTSLSHQYPSPYSGRGLNLEIAMHVLDHSYIDGRFVKTLGEELMDIVSPSTESVIGRLRLAGQDDVLRAIEAAARAQPGFSRSSKQERIALLRRLEDAVRTH